MIGPRSLVALIAALGPLTASGADDPALKKIEAETDRLAPGWRLADLLTKREVIPPEKNGALRVIEVYRGLSEAWWPGNVPSDAVEPDGKADLSTLPGLWGALWYDLKEPRRRLRPEVSRALLARQEEMLPVLEKARILEHFRSGRYPIIIARIIFDTKLADLNNSRAVVQLLQLDAQARADRGDIDGALASCRAMLGVARAVGDEPFAISQFVRMAEEAVAVETISRVLARGEASDAALSATQTALADEASQPLLLIGARGERAGLYDLFSKFASGEIDIRDLGRKQGSPDIDRRRVIVAWDETNAIVLRLLNDIVRICGAPIPEQPGLWIPWERDFAAEAADARAKKPETQIAYMLLPAMRQNSESYGRTRGILRAAELAVGLERVRLTRGRWPKPGESLGPAFPDGPPADPYTDGKPLRWKETDTGLVVYSIGFDQQDGGGNLANADYHRPGTDLGYRLWAPALHNVARDAP